MKTLLTAIIGALLLAAPATAAPARSAHAAASIKIISVTRVASRGSAASVVARVTPRNAVCVLTVMYKSGPSHARGVGRKRAVNGIVSWAWMVGTNTTGGVWPIYVECGNAIVKTKFRVTG